jgi:hypothetical protein
MKHNNHGAQEADCTAQLSERTKLFFQKVGTKHRTAGTQQDREMHVFGSLPDQDTQRAQRRYQYSRRKSVCGKVRDLTQYHC